MSSSELCTSIGKSLPALFECSPAAQEGVRVRTPLLYPDGGVVDVFVLERNGRYIVTDFGDALGWLRMQSVSVRRSRKQQLLIDDVCQTLGIEFSSGQLTLRSGGDDELGETVLLLAQAVVRVSDLWFTLRARSVETTADEVSDWLREKQIPFDRAVRQPGRSGQHWTIDFRTRASERTSLVFLLSTGSRPAVRRITERVLAGCVDLSHLKVSEPNLGFVSLFDDTSDVWREEDFALVNTTSEIALWSRPDELEQLLKAV
jgi:hypothetical protein